MISLLALAIAQEEAVPIDPSEMTSLRPPRTYYFEIFMVCILVLSIINYFIGKNRNEKIATSWMFIIKPLLLDNFKQVGIVEKESEGEML